MCVEFISSGFPFISNFSPRQILLILSGGSFCFNATPVLLATTFSKKWVGTDFEVELFIQLSMSRTSEVLGNVYFVTFSYFESKSAAHLEFISTHCVLQSTVGDFLAFLVHAH